jgi:hypothetical protein
MLEAPGGMPDDVLVVVNHDDETAAQYRCASLNGMWPSTWRLYFAPSGSRVADVYRSGFQAAPDARHYGIIDDDYWPVTAGWHHRMIEAAGPTGIALANNRINFPAPYCCRVMGGDLARAIGTLAPGGMRHNYLDDAWAQFGRDFGVLRPLEDVVVEHRHHLFDPSVAKDETYTRGSSDIDEDRRHYEEWLRSDERRQQCARVAALLGRECRSTTVDLKQVRLVVVTPMGRSSPDVVYHQSYIQFLLRAIQIGGFGHLNLRTQCGGSHPGKVREALLWQAWAEDPTHILFIDDDMGWPDNLVFRLLAADVDFAAVAGVRKQDRASFCCNFFPGPQTFHAVNGFLKVKDVGFAFVLIRRAVIERMIAAYPELAYDAGERTEHALFLDMIDSDRQRLSEDLSFCRRWTAIGGEIWVDPETSLIHAGRKEYSGRLDDVFGRGNRNINMDIVQRHD